MSKNIKKYNKFILERKFLDDVLGMDGEVRTILSEKYYKIYLNQMLMYNLIHDNVNVNENRNNLISKMSTGNWKSNPVEFLDSVSHSYRKEFMSIYSLEELTSFRLFKVEGYNIGFALNGNEIILVHNNSGIGGIGDLLMNKAIQFGGSRLDHFDGFLTGFYRSFGFGVVSNEFFLEQYAPDNWKYEPVDINDINKSIYKSEIKVSKELFKLASQRYSDGKPDIVYRKL